MELQLKLQLETAIARLQEVQNEASTLKTQVAKQAEEIVALQKRSKRTASLERRSPDTDRFTLELQSNPTLHSKILTLRSTLNTKSPSDRPSVLPHRSNPASPYRDMHLSRARLSPVTERRHLRVASDRATKSTRLRTGLRH